MAVAPWVVSDELWEAGRAAASEGRAAVSLPGPQAAAGSAGVAGDLVCAAHRNCLAAAAGGARVRLGDHLLAASGRVAAGRRLGGASCAVAFAVAGGG